MWVGDLFFVVVCFVLFCFVLGGVFSRCFLFVCFVLGRWWGGGLTYNTLFLSNFPSLFFPLHHLLLHSVIFLFFMSQLTCHAFLLPYMVCMEGEKKKIQESDILHISSPNHLIMKTVTYADL